MKDLESWPNLKDQEISRKLGDQKLIIIVKFILPLAK